MRIHTARRCSVVALTALVLSIAASAGAQTQLDRGFAARAPATASGEELSKQSDLWVLQVDLKPVRMISVEVTDPKTGRRQRELIWYLVYRAVNRPLAEKFDTSDTKPVNVEDPQPRPLFVPEFTLATNDSGSQHIYTDVIVPEAEAAIEKREGRELRNPVEAVQPLPEPAPEGEAAGETVYGVVTWRGVDPETDYFTLYMTGFSNGYKQIEGPDGNPLLLRRTLVQKFWRPGDEVNQKETEIRLQDDPKWVYRPDEPTAAASDADAAAGEKATEPPEPEADDDPDAKEPEADDSSQEDGAETPPEDE